MAHTEPKTFARGRRDVDCVDEAMRRAEAAPDMTGQARVSMFLRSCIEAARDTGLCSRVPSGFFGGPRWAMDQCRNRPAQRVNDPCVGVMNGVYQACLQRHLRH